MINNKNYKSLVVLGCQWGDEGKGKITDYFAQNADLVVRFAGGDNAGHVIWNEGIKHKVTIVPSGILNKNVMNIIGNGTVINLEKLNTEIISLQKSGINTSNLYISDRAHLIFKFNMLIDNYQEEERKERKIGTTGRGIGPTYAAKANRVGIRICDFFEPNFKELFKECFDYHNNLITNIYKKEPLNFEELYKSTISEFNKIKNNIIDCGVLIEKEIKSGKKVLFEGAQGVLLDIDHGTYPFVTSSNTSGNNVSIGSGIHAKYINKVVGIAKAYNTRVGAGAMPTEITDSIANRIRETGHEYGSNTGRPRRIGWLDLVALKYAIRTGGIDELFITLLDVLDNEEEIKLCIEYELDNKRIDYIPASNSQFEKCKPVFKTIKGWKTDITKTKTLNELPTQAKEYLRIISDFCEVDILGFSVGSDRKQTVLIKKEFE